MADVDGFILTLRELSEFVSEFSFKDPEKNLGDWRAIKQELKNGDIQGLIYRKCTEINIIYNFYNEKQIEFFVKMKKRFEPLLDKSLENYCSMNSISYPSGPDIAFTLYFSNVREFKIFVYKFLLPLAD